MFERFSEKAIKVIMLAQEEARRQGHNFVGTEQILLGLIGEGTGIAARTLNSMGVNRRDARVEVEKIIGRGSGFVAMKIPFTPGAKRVLELSWDEARQLGDHSLSTEHLLLGLLREGDGVSQRVLENLGVNTSQARAVVMRLIEEWKANPSVFEIASPPVTLSECTPASTWPAEETIEVLNEHFIEALGPKVSRFTDNAIQALRLAQAESRKCRHNFVGTEQILIGLLGTGRGAACLAMQAVGVNISVARNEVAKIIGLGPGSVMRKIPLTPRTKSLIRRSAIEAIKLGCNYCATGHLLLGLIAESEGVANRVLENMDVNVSSLTDKVISLMKSSD